MKAERLKTKKIQHIKVEDGVATSHQPETHELINQSLPGTHNP